MLTTQIVRPGAGEHAPYYSKYIDPMTDADAFEALKAQIAGTARLLGAVPESRAGHRYAPGKWSIKQVASHLADVERVMSYRTLRIGRRDATPLPGFDENTYADASGADGRPLSSLVDELLAVRAATVALFAALDDESLAFIGTANGTPVSPRAIAWIIAGHEQHHVKLLRERYGLTG